MKDRLIVADSCCDSTEEMKSKLDIELVPLTLQLDDVDYLDDENLDVDKYIEAMRNASSIKTVHHLLNFLWISLKKRKKFFV